MARQHAVELWGAETVARALAEEHEEPSEEVALSVATMARELSRDAFGAWARGQPWPTLRAAVRAVVGAEGLLTGLEDEEVTDEA